MRTRSLFRIDTLRGGVLVAAAGLLALVLAVGSTDAQSGSYNVTLTGAEEVPPVTTTATGSLQATVAGDAINYTLTASGEGLTMAHFHVGAPGVNGPVVAFLFGPNNDGVASINETGTVTVDDLVGPLAGDWEGFLEALDGGQIYVNVHSLEYPAGVVRAQLPADQVPGPTPTSTMAAGGTAATTTTTTAASATPRPPTTGLGTTEDGGSAITPLGIALAGAVALAVGGGLALRRR